MPQTAVGQVSIGAIIGARSFGIIVWTHLLETVSGAFGPSRLESFLRVTVWSHLFGPLSGARRPSIRNEFFWFKRAIERFAVFGSLATHGMVSRR